MVVAVVVLGPSRLPELMRFWWRVKHQFRQYYWRSQKELQEALHLDEMKEALMQEEMKQHIEALNRKVMAAEEETADIWTRMKQDLDRPPEALQVQHQPQDYADTGEEPRRDASQEQKP